MPNWKTTPRLEGDIMNAKAIAAALAVGLTVSAAAAQGAEPVLTVPFDFSRQAIGLDVTVKGAPLTMILDTGVRAPGSDKASGAGYFGLHILTPESARSMRSSASLLASKP